MAMHFSLRYSFALLVRFFRVTICPTCHWIMVIVNMTQTLGKKNARIARQNKKVG